MRNSSLRDRQMNASAFVIQARDWARDVVNADVRGPGDLENAMRRVEQRCGIPFAALWGLRYRPPKDVGVSIYTKLQAAHADMCERQMRKFRDELDRTKATGWVGETLIRAADALAGASGDTSQG